MVFTASKHPSYSITAQQKKQFFELGYFVQPDVFSSEEVRRVQKCFEKLQLLAKGLTAPAMVNGSLIMTDGRAIDRIVWCGAAEPELLAMGEDERLVGPSAELLESSTMQQLICQAHFKLPADGVSFAWHQDSEHRRFGTRFWNDVNGKGSYVQTILAVDEMNSGNGPLMIVPRSSQWGHLDLNKRNYHIEFTPHDGILSLKMKPGSVLFMGPYTVHASLPNQSKVPRRVFINGYCSPGANHREYPGKGAGRILTHRV